MSTPSDRVAKLLAKLDAAWAEFRQSYAGLSDEQLTQPGVSEAWSIRDTGGCSHRRPVCCFSYRTHTSCSVV